MDVRPIADSRDIVLTGSTKEFELLGEGLDVLEGATDVDRMMGQNADFSTDYLDGIRDKLPTTEGVRRREQHNVTVDNDELSTLSSGLRAAMGHVRSTQAVLREAPAEVTGALARRGIAYRYLRTSIRPHVTYQPDRA
jgi:hypothetical protein